MDAGLNPKRDLKAAGLSAGHGDENTIARDRTDGIKST